MQKQDSKKEVEVMANKPVSSASVPLALEEREAPYTESGKVESRNESCEDSSEGMMMVDFADDDQILTDCRDKRKIKFQKAIQSLGTKKSLMTRDQLRS